MILNLEGLENRMFKWGVVDCFTMVRDLYLLNFGIKIRNYARPSNWHADVMDLILAGYEREGFMKICDWKLQDLRPGDIMCIAVNEGTPNHFGIYVGDNQFIHHLYGQLSTVAPLKSHWLYATCFILRHPDVPDLTPKKPDTPIEELLRARYKSQASSPSDG